MISVILKFFCNVDHEIKKTIIDMNSRSTGAQKKHQNRRNGIFIKMLFVIYSPDATGFREFEFQNSDILRQQ